MTHTVRCSYYIRTASITCVYRKIRKIESRRRMESYESAPMLHKELSVFNFLIKITYDVIILLSLSAWQELFRSFSYIFLRSWIFEKLNIRERNLYHWLVLKTELDIVWFQIQNKTITELYGTRWRHLHIPLHNLIWESSTNMIYFIFL